MFEIAWKVTTDENDCTYEICATHQEAIRKGALEMDVDGEDCIVERAPWFDRFATVGYVPPEALIKDRGWEYDCWRCEAKVLWDCGYCTEDEGYERHPIEPVFNGKAVYCSQECCDSRRAKFEAQKRLKEDGAIELKLKFPGVEIKDAWVSSDGKTILEFTFPGGRHKVRWTTGDLFVEVTSVDAEAFQAYRESVIQESILCT